MILLQLPWLELSIAVALLGSVWVRLVREPGAAARWGMAFTGTAWLCTLLAALDYYNPIPATVAPGWSVQHWLFGAQIFGLDGLTAPVVPAVALVHFLTALATSRTRMRRFSFSWSLASEAIRLALFSCREASWLLVVLMALCAVPPYFELKNRRRPTRVYVLHMSLFIGLLVLGWAAASARVDDSTPSAWVTVPLLLAVLVRSGSVPAHCWITDWFEHASFGNALLFATPLVGVFAAVRLVLPIAPDWVLHSIGIVSLITAVYAAGMGLIQRDTRRFFAYLFLSHASLVLVGLELGTALSLTGSLCLWFSVILSLGGFGLTLRAVEARFGRLSLFEFHGLYSHAPTLAVCFLLTGLASVGFPGTLGFVSTDILVDSAVEVNLTLGVAVVAAAALNGIAVMRAYFRLFSGSRDMMPGSLRPSLREQIAVLTLATLVVAGGLFPQPGVATRFRAAEEIFEKRHPHPVLAGAVLASPPPEAVAAHVAH